MGDMRIASAFDREADLVLFQGDCLELLSQIPDGFVKLVVTSPPYNLGKPYESRLALNNYLGEQRKVIDQCVRKYPGKKYFEGPKKGELSCNPIGKNPGDVWEIPNVKANHVEKTVHPCQFPVELVERLVLSMTEEGDWVLDPFMGVGSTAIAALMHGRKAIGAEIMPEYLEIARERILKAERGQLRIRPMERSVYDPDTPAANVPPQTVRLGPSPLQL